MIKLIASDLDGTMLPDGTQELDPGYYTLIREMHEAGIHFAVASGRQYTAQLKLMGPVRDIVSFIAENGAFCLQNGIPFVEKHFDRELAERIILATRRFPDCGLAAGCNGFTYVEDRGQHLTDIIDEVLNTPLVVLDDMTKYEEAPFKVALWCPEDTAGHAAALRELFHKECRSVLKIITSGDHWIDFMYGGVNKGDALRVLMNRMGVSREETAAFGDQYNDVEMLKLAGTSFVVSTCAPGMEKYADHVTDPVLESMRQLLDENRRSAG